MKYQIEEIIPTVQYGNIHITVDGEDEEGTAEAFFALKTAYDKIKDRQPPFKGDEFNLKKKEEARKVVKATK